MKSIQLLEAIIFVSIAFSCQRSQFSTTTRCVSNGKVIYVNHYEKERFRNSKVKSQKMPAQENFNMEAPDNNLVAAVSKIFPLVFENKMPVLSKTPDTTKKNILPDGVTYDTIKKIPDNAVIKFKSGETRKAKILSQSTDKITYQLLKEPDVIRTVDMGNVDSIYYEYHYKVRIIDKRPVERASKQAILFSLLGFIPLLGLFFGATGFVLGIEGLIELHRYPDLYNKKSKGQAIAGIILGLITFSGWLLLLIMFFSGFSGGMSGFSM